MASSSNPSEVVCNGVSGGVLTTVWLWCQLSPQAIFWIYTLVSLSGFVFECLMHIHIQFSINLLATERKLYRMVQNQF